MTLLIHWFFDLDINTSRSPYQIRDYLRGPVNEFSIIHETANVNIVTFKYRKVTFRLATKNDERKKRTSKKFEKNIIQFLQDFMHGTVLFYQIKKQSRGEK